MSALGTTQTIYFAWRGHHRYRQRETVEHVPAGIRVLAPDLKEVIRDFDLVEVSRLDWRFRLKRVAQLGLAPNLKWIRDPLANEADLVYTWGAIPLIRKPFIIELDNPLVLTYYSLRGFYLWRKLLRLALQRSRCVGMLCISKACRESLKVFLGDTVIQKARVVYPYIASHLHQRSPRRNYVNVLFIATQFYIKGGRELLEAFSRITARDKRTTLTVVSNVPPPILERFGDNPQISFLPAKFDKAELFAHLYPRTDIFVLPTYQESFGLVILEALSFGLPIIATDLYAIPELVRHGENGFLIEPPFRYFTRDHLPHPKVWAANIERLVRASSYPEVVDALESRLTQLIEDAAMRRRMSENAAAHFEENFTVAIRDRAFLEAVGGLPCRE